MTDIEADKEAQGLLAYIRMTHAKSDEGYTLKRMELERGMALRSGGAGGTGSGRGGQRDLTAAALGSFAGRASHRYYLTVCS